MKNKIINNISWSFAENILTEIISFLVSIVLARYLYPSDYGLISLIQIFITITSIVVSNGLGAAIIQDKDIDEDQISTLFYLNLLIGLFLYIVLFVTAPIIAREKENYELVSIIRVLAIKIPIASIYSMQHSYIKKKLEFKKFFFSSLFGTLIAGIVGIYMAIKSYGHWALITSTLIDQIMDCVILFLTSKWFPKPKMCLKKTKKQIIFGFDVLTSEFISRLFPQIRSLIVGIRYTTADLAYDSKSKKIPDTIVNTINSSVVRVLNPILSKENDKKDRTLEIVRKSTQLYCFIICPIMMGLFSTCDIFIPMLLTEKWSLCIPYIKIYCLSRALFSLTIFDDKIITAYGKGKLLIFNNIISIFVEALVMLLSIVLFNNPLIFAISSYLSSIIICLIRIVISNRLVSYSFINHIEDIASPLVISITMIVIIKFVSLKTTNNILLLIIEITEGVLVYSLLSLALKTKQTKLFLSLFNNYKKH